MISHEVPIDSNCQRQKVEWSLSGTERRGDEVMGWWWLMGNRKMKRVLEIDGDSCTIMWMKLMPLYLNIPECSHLLFPLILSCLYSKPFIPTLFIENKSHTSELSLQTYSPLFPFVLATLQPIWLLQSSDSKVKSLSASVLGVKLGKGGGYLCFHYSGHIYYKIHCLR